MCASRSGGGTVTPTRSCHSKAPSASAESCPTASCAPATARATWAGSLRPTGCSPASSDSGRPATMRRRTLLPLTLVAALTVATVYVGTAPAAEVSAGGAKPRACDPLDEAHCLLPFPNDYFTVEDDDTST